MTRNSAHPSDITSGAPRRARRLGMACVALVLAAGLAAGCRPPNAVIDGSVHGSADAPIGGVTVAVYPSTAAEVPTTRTTTGIGGTFVIGRADLPDGTYVVEIAGRWWTGVGLSTDPADAASVTVDALGDPVHIDATVEVDTAFTGRVVDSRGSAVAGRFVVLDDTAGHFVAFTETGAEGTFRLPVAAAGTYRIALVDPAGGRLATIGGGTPTEFTVADGQTLDLGTLAVTTVVSTAAGMHHTCALHAAGTVSCWGANDDGQLGNGTTDDSDVPVAVEGIDDATAVVAGIAHTCVLHATGAVSCWGSGTSGALGNGTTSSSSTPVTVTGITDATAIAATSSHHTCALRASGAVSCWGSNGYGQLGNGTLSSSSVPGAVIGLDDAVSIAAGGTASCAVHVDGDVSCWGDNYFGELGNDTSTTSKTPTPVSGIHDARSVTVGGGHACALRVEGVVSCWGYNSHGQVGDGTTDDAHTPHTVGSLPAVDAIAAGFAHTCARATADHSLRCWGADDSGQLGDGTGPEDHPTPVSVVALSDVVSVAAAYDHTCAVVADGSMACWGDDHYGALGAVVPDGHVTTAVPLWVVDIPVKRTAP